MTVDIYQCLPPPPPSLIVSMVLRCLSALVSIRSVKVTFSLFQSLCSSYDANRSISSPYISSCVACSALLFGPNMYLSKTYKPCKKRTSTMRINKIITLLPFSRPNFYGVQCKIDDPFSSGRLALNPLTCFYVCRHYDLLMRIYLKHYRGFLLTRPAIGVKLFIKCLAAHIARAFQ